MDMTGVAENIGKKKRGRGGKILLGVVLGLAFVCVALVAGLAFWGLQTDVAAQGTMLSLDQVRIAELEAALAESEEARAQSEQTLTQTLETYGLSPDAPPLESLKGAARTKELDKRIAKLTDTLNTLSRERETIRKAELAAKKTDNVQKVCYLTFDDGPSEQTPKVLEVLKKYNVKATFFVVNSKKLAYLKDIHAQGHAVGLHSDTHDYAKIYANDAAFADDLATISGRVEKILGFAPKIMRFPGGSSNRVSLKYNDKIITRLTQSVQAQGYSYFDWNVDSRDALAGGNSAKAIFANIKAGSEKKNQICVLMHDSRDKATTVQALPQVIEYLQGEGYTFAPLTVKTLDVFHHPIKN
ncbi:MAG: polysaccharide deacetylase [Oscillospiraceae bacterium]|jgi:peptidoglycan/xylan/chitin deacetylase (PgdA/CDA1 family)|nr:polysaccharide deacetylase [Oscillospiraceae bacterium]